MLAPIGMPVRGLARRGHIARGPSRAQTVPYIHNMPTLCISCSLHRQISVVANGSYWAFQKLGNYYGVGNLLMVIYAVCNAIGQFFTLVVPIDAPLRMLLGDENARRFVPKGLLKQNDKGAYINGIKMVVVLIALGFIQPEIRKIQDKKEAEQA